MKNNFLNNARAAIEAMREPTEAMVDACGANYHHYEIYDNWQAMIDAAIAESDTILKGEGR
jgi:hypothetical protein